MRPPPYSVFHPEAAHHIFGTVIQGVIVNDSGVPGFINDEVELFLIGHQLNGVEKLVLHWFHLIILKLEQLAVIPEFILLKLFGFSDRKSVV